MKAEAKRIIAVIINALIVLLVINSIIQQFYNSTTFGSSGFVIFRYYTILSNIVAGASALILLIYHLIVLKKKTDIPIWAENFKYTGTTVVSVTFLTVVFFLGLLYGYASMFSGASLYTHLITPLLCIISFLFFDGIKKLRLIDIVFPIALTIIYGIVYVVNVIVIGEGKGGWPDFYGFNIGGMWYISVVIMLAGTALLSFGLYILKKKVIK